MTEGVNHFVNDPAWWFSTIFVAIVVNIISALLYDSLKSLYTSVTIKRLLIFCQICYALAIFISCFKIKTNNYFVRNNLPVLGLAIPFLVLFDMYSEVRYRFIGIATTLIVFIFNVTWVMIRKNPTYTADWLATQFFGAFLLSVVVTVLMSSALLILARKRQLRNYRD
jgi:hypothetical protein